MKKLELNQMENLNGGLSGRNCLLMGGAVAVFGIVAGVGGAVGAVFAGGAIGGFFTAASADCF